MATAVSMWSPVIMMGRMPAPRHSSMAALTSGRTGSIMPVRPMKMRSCSRLAGEQSAGTASHLRMEAASTRSARSAMALLAARISALLPSVMGTTLPFSRQPVQSLSTSSGAPLVYWTTPSAVWWTVLIILRMESKGASPTRGSADFSAGLPRPRPWA